MLMSVYKKGLLFELKKSPHIASQKPII